MSLAYLPNCDAAYAGWKAAVSHEDVGVALLRDAYVAGRLCIEDFERGVGLVLTGDYSVVPFPADVRVSL